MPVSTTVAAVLAWTVWCETETGTRLGGALVAGTGLLVFALSQEALPHRGGPVGAVRRTALAVALGIAAAAVAFLAAGLGYELTCSPF